MKKSTWTIIGVIIIVIIAVAGGSYWHMSHAVAKNVPGNTYRYQSVSKDKTLYVTFAQSGDKAIVNQSKDMAVDAASSQTAFDKAYKTQSEDSDWTYKASGNVLTLAKEDSDGNISQWQYNGILATKKKFTSHNFTYQIAKAGQGTVKSKTVFEKVN